MENIKIRFIVEFEDEKGEIIDSIEEVKKFENNVYGYEKYKSQFADTYKNLVEKISNDKFNLISLISEISNNKLSRTKKLLFMSSYKDLNEIQKYLEEVANHDFRSPFCIWRTNLNREFGIKLEVD